MVANTFITRLRSGRGFSYYQNGRLIIDRRLIKYLRGLEIPQSWRNVLISPFHGSKVLAKGIDTEGKRRTIYNPDYRVKSDTMASDFGKG